MTTKMNPSVKTKWLEALRSGKYEQGQGALRTGEAEFCCLGVLCDILEPKGWTHDSGEWRHGEDAEIESPSSEIIQLAQIPRRHPKAANTLPHLSSMNDDGESFAVIAEWIEENL